MSPKDNLPPLLFPGTCVLVQCSIQLGLGFRGVLLSPTEAKTQLIQ